MMERQLGHMVHLIDDLLDISRITRGAIGDVVGLKFMGKGRWTVGAVRWITQLDEGGMEFGVQFLAFSARPVWVQPVDSGSPQMKQGLVFEGGEGEEAALLTTPALFEDLRTYSLDDRGDSWEVRASSLIEKTPRFDLFHFRSS